MPPAVSPPPQPPSPSPPPILFASGGEPDLSSVSSLHESDRVTLRNVIYTLWAVGGSQTSSSSNTCYVGYNVRRLQDRGYLILAFFAEGYRISYQDMQLLADVCPLRIDSMFVRGVQEDDFSLPSRSKVQPSTVVAAVLSICVLDANQPVRITEAEVVRVRKRSRGLLHSLLGI